ncbi:MAG: transcription antitermination factor NusB [Anaerolineae bacterium]|nr:transcription antitermination factor NusB [Anaerolineae bacterium]MCA9892511.1 transcription antitermination factor NusB [Anaerolineae bacterium]MCB9461921.1 transcription antitermination factor NusB [Anaerolineaceae bacterium]
MTDDYDFIQFDPDSDDIVDREVVEHTIPSTDRSIARRVTLQVLYEIDAANHLPGEVLQNMLTHEEEVRKVRSYVRRLVTGILDNREAMDAVLQTYAPEFPLQQIAIVDRNILRIALFEMAIGTRTPIGVAIDEAVELAKLFGADGSARFVNGVLGTIAQNIDDLRQGFVASDAEIFVEDDLSDEDDTEQLDGEPATEPPSSS